MSNSGTENNEMSFLQHLEILRWHLIRSVIVIIIFGIILFMNNDIVFGKIIFGPKHPDFLTYRAFCKFSEVVLGNNSLCIDKINFELTNFDLSGQFTKHIWISFLGGLVLAFPYILWELWRFVKPALKTNEKKSSTGFMLASTFLFLIGILFAYYIIAPLTINFLGNYSVYDEIQNRISLDSYISTITTLVLATGLVFELPVVIYFLSRFGVITPKFMRKYRKHAIVIILIVAAIITPSPDVASQLLVAIPLYVLYEVSVFVSAYVVAKQKKS